MMRGGRGRRQTGGVLIELAFLVPLLALLLVGVVHFGYVLYTYNKVEKAVHDAARYASMRSFWEGGAAAYLTNVRNTAVFGNPAGAGVRVAPNLQVANINVILNRAAGPGRPTSVTVSVSGYSIPGAMNVLSLAGKPVATFPFLGRYVPAP